MAQQSKQSSQDAGFGELLEELERIIAWFESGEVDLDQAVEEYERGMELVSRLHARLETTEAKIADITRDVLGEEAAGDAPESTEE